jgi:hypothetical protein
MVRIRNHEDLDMKKLQTEEVRLEKKFMEMVFYLHNFFNFNHHFLV